MNNNDYDLILKNGMVVRPNSSEVLQQDIAIKNGKIFKIGKLSNEKSKERFNAA